MKKFVRYVPWIIMLFAIGDAAIGRVDLAIFCGIVALFIEINDSKRKMEEGRVTVPSITRGDLYIDDRACQKINEKLRRETEVGKNPFRI